MTASAKELLPCPWCGGSNVKLYCTTEDDVQTWYAQCGDCTSCGPDHKNGRHWNDAPRTAHEPGQALCPSCGRVRFCDPQECGLWHGAAQPPAPVRGVDLVTERDHGYAEGYSDAVNWQPIETAPKNGNFQVCLESCPDLSWPAHSNDGELWSKAHGPLNRMVQGRVTKATHWRPAHPRPTKEVSHG